MVMQSLRSGASSGLIKIVLFGLLIMAVGGLVLTDVGGFFRGGLGRADIVKVGSKNIHINSFDRTIQRVLRRIGVSPQEAYKAGYIDELLRNEVRTLLLQQTASDLGINVSAARIARHVNAIVEPLATDEQSPQDILKQILLSQGVSESEFSNAISQEIATGLITNALRSNFSLVAAEMLEDLYMYRNESRSIALVPFAFQEMKNIEDPTKEILQSFYEQQKELFAIPERRAVRLALINPEKLAGTVTITPERLHEEYEHNIESYKIPERRIVDQAILETRETALKVAESAKKSGNLKKAVKDSGAPPESYLGENNFGKDDFDEKIRMAVFENVKKGDVVGPVETAFGWQIIIVKEVIAPRTKSFEEVEEILRAEFQDLETADLIYQTANAVDDMLAGGASFEETAQAYELEILDLGTLDSYGQKPDGKDGAEDALKDFMQDGQTILQTAFALTEGETAPVTEISDGRFIAVNLSAIHPKNYKPYEEVEDRLKKEWTAEQRSVRTRTLTSAQLELVKSGSKTLAQIAKDNGKGILALEAIKRGPQAPAPLLSSTIPRLFNADVNEVLIVDIDGGQAVAQITRSRFPEAKEISAGELESLRKELQQAAQNEALALLIESKRKHYKVKVNQGLMDRLYGPGNEDVVYP